ncbi:hypothetical protein EJ04DRAFT_260244 [Polyplosphaeria fusca]|uniref:N-acetyltransferase domain-containing protein n=1 Tax=Polyplosphaeria fusca TaxID=682080 RepID=A0A9P4R874_9PLEO|nr:hypothetical protein EJ04DRAFT_260244 [Polyplosphaeria fusca]
MGLYTTALLPKTHPDSELWIRLINRQKQLRLQALRLSPESFSSTHDREAAFSNEEWEARLQNPLAFTFVVARRSDGLSKIEHQRDALVEDDWVGFGVLFALMGDGKDASNGSGSDNKDVIEFSIFGLYIVPSERKLGLGRKLIEAMIEHGMTLAKERGASAAVFKLSVASPNARAQRLYEKLGFRIVTNAGTEVDGMGVVAMQLKRSV